VALVAAFMNY